MLDPRVNLAKTEGVGRGQQQQDDPTQEAPPPARAADRPVPQDPEQIGAYRILECLGEGGMGIVYKAEQHTPRRIVALKIVKLGMDSKQVVARFEAERQALAMLAHPNVAKVLDGGVTDRGRPYFAMEYVPGVPITRYCQSNHLPVNARLSLFISVCEAIQHAHQKGIIHRDLKPTNILVQMSDGQPVPKVIDFGIAKATNAALTDRTLHTQTGAMIGTPEYMSPEQAMTSGLDVDTRTDIYSLGVILYELLTGMLPFDPRTLREAGPEGMARIIRESDPHKPSTRLSEQPAPPPAAGASAAAARNVRALRREISGDLDWITLKAMEKDRTRRYETADAMATDLRRYLNLQPVLARPPSARYRLGKFTRRHKRGVLATGLVVIALLLGFVGTSIGLVKARRAAEQARLAEIKARQQAEKATTLSRFLENMLASASPGAAGGRAATVVNLLDRAASDMQEKLKGQPDVEINARFALVKTYAGLGLYKPAEENARRALALASATFGNQSEPALEIAAMQSFLLRKTDALDESLALARQTRDTSQQVLGPHHAITREAANNLSVALSMKGDHDAAITIQRQLVNDVRQHPQDTSRARAGAYANNLGLFVQHQYGVSHDPRLLAEAETLFRQAVDDVQADDAAPANVVVMKENLAKVLRRQEKYAQAVTLTQEALAHARTTLGDSHSTTHQIRQTHAEILEALARYTEALDVRQDELKEARVAPQPDDESIAAASERVAYDLAQLRRFDQAATRAAEAVAIRRRLFNDDDDEARTWYRGYELLAFASAHPWSSPALKADSCRLLLDLLGNHPARPGAADGLAFERLRFKLLRWDGFAPNDQPPRLTPVAQGSAADLRALPDPAAGVYLMWLEVPRADRQPLHHAGWLHLAPWRISTYATPFSPRDNPSAWADLIKTKAAAESSLPSLALDSFWRPPAAPTQSQTEFGVVASADLRLPPGPYTIVLRADDGARVWLNDKPVADQWSGDASATVSRPALLNATGPLAEVELEPGALPRPHHLRVEYYQRFGPYSLWLRLEPAGKAAARAKASLLDLDEPYQQALAKLNANPALARDPALLERRGNLHLRVGRFNDAADDYLARAQLDPAVTDHFKWFQAAILLALAEDEPAFRQRSQRMYELFAREAAPEIKERVAKVNLLLPGVSDAQILDCQALIDTALKDEKRPNFLNWYYTTKGIAEYRAGRHQAAIQWLGRPRAAEYGIYARCQADLFLAMAQHKLKRDDDARAALSAALATLASVTDSDGKPIMIGDGNLIDWAYAQVARREAQNLLAQP